MGIAGMLRSKNISLVSFAENSPSVRVAKFDRVPAVCDVVIDEVTLEREDVEGVLLGRVVANLKGHVASIRSGSIPGHEGQLVAMAFDERQTYDSEDDSVSTMDAQEAELTVNNDAPTYVLRNVFTFDESYIVGAKGGFVPGYAEGAIPDELIGSTLRDMPMELNLTEFMFPSGHGSEVTYDGGNALFALDIVDQYGYEVTSAQTGYNIAELLNVDKTMVEHPQNTVDTVARTYEDSDEYAVANVDQADLLDALEGETAAFYDQSELAAEEAEPEVAEDSVDAEAEAAASAVDTETMEKSLYDHAKVVGMFANDRRAIGNIFGGLFGDVVEQPEASDEVGLADEDERDDNNQRMMRADMQLAGSASLADAQQNVEDAPTPSVADMVASDDEIEF